MALHEIVEAVDVSANGHFGMAADRNLNRAFKTKPMTIQPQKNKSVGTSSGSHGASKYLRVTPGT